MVESADVESSSKSEVALDANHAAGSSGREHHLESSAQDVDHTNLDESSSSQIKETIFKEMTKKSNAKVPVASLPLDLIKPCSDDAILVASVCIRSGQFSDFPLNSFSSEL
jgi:hypothetical protein